MLGWLICKVTRKHKRGKRLKPTNALAASLQHQAFECPRCKATWVRKVRNAAT